MKQTSRRLRGALLAGVLLMVCGAARGQTSTSTVRGTVLDQSGAVIPSAALTLVNQSTNIVARTSANGAGIYVFPSVVPGEYRISAESPGLEKYEAKLVVQVAETLALDVVLKVSGATQSISVQDATPLTVTDSPALSTVLDRKEIEQLPIDGRGWYQFLSNVPGTIFGDSFGRAYGMRAGSAEVSIDGSSTTERTWGQTTVNGGRIGLEGVQEFKAETNSFSAKYTRPMTVVISSRSGTNQIHGSLFETNRNSSIGVARKRQDYWTKAPPLNRNEWGGSLGGPVFIPGLYNGKNRTFWFFTYEGMRVISRSTLGYAVPTEAMRNGDFSGLTNSSRQALTIYDPWTTDSATWARQPFNHGGKLNVIPPSRISPTAKYIYSLMPLPNLTNVNPLVANNLWLPAQNFTRSASMTSRVDHKFTDADRFFARWTRMPGTQRNSTSGSKQYISYAIDNPDIGQIQDRRVDQTLALSYTHIFSPTLFNDLLLSGAHFPYYRTQSAYVDYTSKLGIPNPFNALGHPSFTNMSFGANGDLYGGGIRYDSQYNFVIDDNATKVHGKHELQFGFHVKRTILNEMTGNYNVAPTLDFGTGATALYDPRTGRTSPGATPLTGFNVANVVLGIANYSVTQGPPFLYMRDNEWALYFQDNFHVSPRLTLNIGLRWEFYPEFSFKDNVMSTFDQATKSIVLGRSMSDLYSLAVTAPSAVTAFQALGARFGTYEDLKLPRRIYDPNLLNFAPRFGFAYRLAPGSRTTVLRGGYRIAYSQTQMTNWIYNYSANTPFSPTFTSSVTSAAQAPDGISNLGLRTVPQVVAGVNSQNVIRLDQTVGISRGATNSYFFAMHNPDVRYQDWNVTLEREVLPNLLARVAYVGGHGSYLPQYNRMNDGPSSYVWYKTTGQPLPTGTYAPVATRPFDQQVYGNISQYGKWGWSNYNGLQLELKRRYARGFGGYLAYNLGNAFATGNQGVDDIINVPNVAQFLPGAMPTDIHDRNRLYLYQRDTAVPKHAVRWNWNVELPFGRGKALARDAKGILNHVIGGWQMAGTGNLRSNWFGLPTNIFPTGTPVEIYGYKYPIEDCRSGACYPGYLWWNGYISPNQINSRDATGKPNGIMGVPDNYKPAGMPLIPWGTTALPANAPAGTNLSTYWNGNTVWVPLKNGSIQQTTYDAGNFPPFRNQYFPSVRQWNLNASLFKTVKLRERLRLALHIDFFNVLNHPGNPNSVGGDGVLSTRSSGSGARVTQLSGRLTW